MNTRASSTNDSSSGCGCIIGILILLGLLVSMFVLPASQTDVTITVAKAETHCSNSDCEYLVFTKHADGSSGEVFEDTDMWQLWKFNSSDVYAQIQPDHTYRAHVAGWRIPFLSWYRDIISVNEVKN